MQKYFIVYCFLLSAFFTNTTTTYAGGAGALEPTQLLNNFELIGVNVSDAITAVQQQLSTVKQLIDDPIASSLIDAAQKSITSEILNWANGGFDGAPSLIVEPESFIKNAGLTAINQSLKQIPVDSVLGDSVFNTLLSQNMEYNLSTKLKELAKSPTASIFRETNCSDLDTLYKIAEKDVAASGGNATTRYNELYNAICDGDLNDPNYERRLDQIARDNPSLGGWELWLTSTSDTPQQREQKSVEIVNEKVAKAKELAFNEVFNGVNAVSKKECKERIDPNDDNSECATWEILNPGESVQAAIDAAAGAGLDRLKNLTGADGLSSLLGGYIVKSLTGALSRATSNTQSNGGTVTTTTQPQTEDLANDPEQKATLLAPILTDLNTYEKKLKEHRDQFEKNFEGNLNTYRKAVDDMKKCYDDLTDEFASEKTNAENLYGVRDKMIQEEVTKQTDTLRKIESTLTYIEQTRTTFNSVKSSQALGEIRNTYTTNITTSTYISRQQLGERQGYINRKISEANRDTELKSVSDNCISLKSRQKP